MATNKEISELTERTNLNTDDLLVSEDDSAATYHKTQVSDFVTSLAGTALTRNGVALDFSGGLADLSDVGSVSATDGHVIASDGTDFDSEAITSLTEAHVNLSDLADVDTTVGNSQLTNSSLTVTAGNGLTTGGSVALGGSVTLDVATDGITTDELDLSIAPTWTGGHTFNADLTLGQNSQNYLVTGPGYDAQAIAFQGQSSATRSEYAFFTKDGDGTDNLNVRIVGLGTPSNVSDRENLLIRYISSGGFDIQSEADGTGTLQPINLYTGSNTNQLVLSTSGNVNMESGTLGVGTGVDSQDTSVGLHIGSNGIRSDGRIGVLGSNSRGGVNIRTPSSVANGGGAAGQTTVRFLSGASAANEVDVSGDTNIVSLDQITSATLTASSSQTTTNAIGLRVDGAPSAGTNITATNQYALLVAAAGGGGKALFKSGPVGVNLSEGSIDSSFDLHVGSGGGRFDAGLAVNTGGSLTGTMELQGSPPVLTFDDGGGEETKLRGQMASGLADGGKFGLQDTSGYVIIMNSTDGTVATFSFDSVNDAVTEIDDPSNTFTTTEGNDTTANVYWDSTNSRFELNNELGGSKDFRMFYIGT